MTTLPFLLAAGLLTLAALAAVLRPVLRPRPPADDGPAGGPELAVYRDQLAEIGRDLERGLIRPEEAAAARLEVERRLLRAAAAAAAVGEGRETLAATGRPGRGGRAAAVAAAALLLVPVLTAGLYLRLGAPGLPGRPLAERPAEELAAGGRDPGPQVREMVARLEARLRAEPGDLEGWLMLGRSKGVLGDAPAAAAAYRRALALAPDDPGALGGLGETLVALAGGVVTPEAEGLLERLRRADAADPRAGYYLGLAAAQAGDGRKALDLWRGLLAATPADAPWRPRLEESVSAAARELGLDPASVLAQAPPAPAPPASAPEIADAAAAAARMSPEEQREFVQSMVGRLEARLAADGADRLGWLRLAQARLVLGEPDKARAAYERGLALHPDDPALLKGYAALLVGPPEAGDGLPRIGDDAARLYERAAAAAPEDPEAQWFLGVRALQQGRRDEARDRWRRVLGRIGPDHPDRAPVERQLDSLGG